MKNSRVLLVAGDSLVRLGLRSALGGTRISIAGEAAGALDGIAKASVLQPDIVIISLRVRHLEDLLTVREMAGATQMARIIVVSEQDGEGFVEQALMCGASAYLLRETAAQDLKWAVNAVQSRREYFSPLLIERLRSPSATMPEPDQHEALVELVNPMEARLRRMIRQGFVIRELARELSAEIRLVRQQHPELLAQLKPRRLRRMFGWLLSGRGKPAALEMGAAV